jgi:hypothetical protein
MKKDLLVHERSLETVAIWTQYLSSFTVGTLTLTAHRNDTNLLDTQVLEKVSAFNQWRMARLSRNTAADEINAICQRICGTVESTLPDNDEMRQLVRGVRAVKSRSFEAVTKRGAEAYDLWVAFNAHRAAMSPAQPALQVDDVTVSAFQSVRGNYAQLLSNVKAKDIAHNGKQTQVRTTVKRVDRQNKRWFQAWQSHFAPGTPQREALSRVSTETSQSTPGQGVFLAHELLPDRVVRLTVGAARALSFTIEHQGPADTEFSPLAENILTKTYDHTNAPVGVNKYRVTPRNNSGTGTPSVVLELTVAAEAAA